MRMAVGVWAVGMVLVAAGHAAERARAEEEPKETYAQLREQHETARKEKNKEETLRLVPLLAGAAVREKDEAQSKDAIAILNRHLTYGTEVFQIAGLRGFAMIARPGSSQYLRSFVVGDKAARRSTEVRKAALEAWASIHDPGCHETLLDLVRTPSSKVEDLEMALHAVKCYRLLKSVPKRQRFTILREYLLAYQNVFDSNASYVSGSAQTWWGGLNAPLLEGFNHLTDQKFRTLQECTEWWRDNKAKIQADRD